MQLGTSEVAAPASLLENEAREGQLENAGSRLREIDEAAAGFLAFLERTVTAGV